MFFSSQGPDLAQRGVCAHGRQVFLGVGCENIFPGCGYVWVENMSGGKYVWVEICLGVGFENIKQNKLLQYKKVQRCQSP